MVADVSAIAARRVRRHALGVYGGRHLSHRHAAADVAAPLRVREAILSGVVTPFSRATEFCTASTKRPSSGGSSPR